MKDSILVVDDNQFERNLVVKALAARAQGCEMRQAGTAEEALASVAGDAPSIVLMDCKLPRMSGIDALRRLREEGHTFPVIVCTAANATELVLEALRAGATDYLVKDKNFFEMLPIAVDKAIGLHRLEAEKAKILERLRQSKDRYERLVVNAHDIMFQVDTKGRFLYVNPAAERELGHRPDEFYDDPELACRLVHPEDRDRVRKTWGTLLQDGGEAVIETRVAAGGLQTQWYQVKIFGVPAQTGQILQGIARNVTESRELARQLQKEKAQLEEANRRLQEVNRLKNEFVASVSHELRTPMNSIIGYTDCLLDGLDGPLADEQASSLTRVRKNAGQLLNLLNDILDTAKIEAGKMQVNAENFDLGELGREALAVAKPLVRDSEVELIGDFAEKLPVKADYDKIRRILLNLLSNAVKFTPSGHVKLSARVHSSVHGSVKIEVEDTGIGIKAEDLPFIFDDFRQVGGSQNRKFGGTGLGLSITRKLVELHGGQVWVKSTPEIGSTFHVVLPILPDDEVQVPAEVPELKDADAPVGAGLRVVLIIDRQADTPVMMKKVLVSEGYGVVGTADVEEGIRYARELKPFAILLDPALTRTSGALLIEALRADPETRRAAVIALTSGDERDGPIALGATDTIPKPVDMRVLIEKVRALEQGKPQPSILVVEDEQDTVQLFQDMMRIAGYTDIRISANGERALEEIAKRRPELVLMDLSMPVMDGFELIARLRKEPATIELPIIVVTGRVLTEPEETFLTKHVRKVVHKQALEQMMLSTGLRSIMGGGGGE